MFKQSITTLIILCISVTIALAQNCNQLSQIIETGIQNSGGLGQDFTGAKGPDGILYFRGSSDGIRLSVWSTDGTEDGTRMVIEDESEWGNSWREVLLSETAAFVSVDNDWHKLLHGEKELIPLPEFGNRKYQELVEAPDGWYYFTGQAGAGYYSVRYNPETDEVVDLDRVYKFSPKVVTFAGTEGALFTNPIFSEPNVYLKESNEVLALNEYITSLGRIASKSKGGYIHEEFMYAALKDADNYNDYVLVNMKTKEIKESPFLGNPLQSYDFEDYFILISSTGVTKINKSDLSTEELFDDVHAFFNDVYPWHTSVILGNQLLLRARIGENNNPIVSINLDTDEVVTLPDSEVGELFIRSKFLVHNDQFHYISQREDDQVLHSYDFEAGVSTTIETLSVNSSSMPINHALESVKGNLVASKRYDFTQHELFQCDAETSEILSINSIELSLTKYDDSSIRVDWMSYYRPNVEMEIVQRSTDLESWQDLSVQMHEENNSSYSFMDSAPKSGINYYRIKQMNKDGEEKFSDIRSARIEKEIVGDMIYPNPSSSSEIVHINSTNKYDSCIVMDETGQVVSRHILTGNPQRISMANMTPGIYLCRLSNEGTSQVIKLTIVQ